MYSNTSIERHGESVSESNLPPESWRPLFDRAGIEFGYRPLAKRAGLTHTRVHRLVRGGGTTNDAIDKVAEALRVKASKVRELRGEAAVEIEPFILPDEAGRLTDMERSVIRQMVRALLDARELGSEDTSTQDTQGDPQTHGSPGADGASNTRAGNAGADKPDALISGDQGSRDDYDLARRTGITEYEWRMANEPQPENENQDTGTNDPA